MNDKGKLLMRNITNQRNRRSRRQVLKQVRLTWEQMRKLPKVLIHEHIDCSLRVRTMLELWAEKGFDKAQRPLPGEVVELWNRAAAMRHDATHEMELNAAQLLTAADQLEADAASMWQKQLVQFSSDDLQNYLDCIGWWILPIMQTREALYRITRERIEDAFEDGIIALELRFAPQLHIIDGLTLDEVMDTVIAAMKDSPIPVDLTLCALRHEEGKYARALSDLCVKYLEVGNFDLAGGEGIPGCGGVLEWWLTEAVRARELRESSARPLQLKCHLWEAKDPEPGDAETLHANGIKILGHGFRGNQQDGLVLEINPTSNLVTGQVARFEDHPIDRLYRDGFDVTLNLDGMTLTGLTGQTDECMKMQEFFGWGIEEFYTVFSTALSASNFSGSVKHQEQAKLDYAYILLAAEDEGEPVES